MQVEKLKIKGWKKKVVGIIISENNQWVLVKHVEVDYLVDGFKIYNKNFIIKRIPVSENDSLHIVLNLKKVALDFPKSFKFCSTIELLKWSEKKYGLFEFQDDVENELFYGKLNSFNKDEFIIDMIKSDGKIEFKYDYSFDLNEIRSLAFESDYFNSIILLMNYELTKN